MRIIRYLLLIVAFSVIAPLAVSAQGDALPFKHTSCATGVDLTGQTVNLYHILNPTDQVDTAPNSVRAGFADATEYFNAHGGICGATVAQVFTDQDDDPQTIYARFSQLKPKPVLVTLYGSADTIALAASLASDKIPAVNVHGGSVASTYGAAGNMPGWVFAAIPTYTDQIGSMCDYIKANPDRFPKPVIGFMNAFDDWATQAATNAKGYCQSLGIGIAGETGFEEVTATIHPEVQKLVDNGATIIYTNSLNTGPALIARTLAEMNLKGKVTLAAVNWGMDPYIAFSGEANLDANGVPLISGMLGSLPTRTWAERDQPGIQLIIQQADLRKRSVTMRSDGYIMGWDTTDLFIEVYIVTGNRVGFNHITGTDIQQTLENIHYAPMGGIEQIDYQGGKRRALSLNRIGELDYLGKDGKTPASADNPPMVVTEGNQKHLVPMIIPLTDYQPAPDLRLPGMTAPATDAAATPPAN